MEYPNESTETKIEQSIITTLRISFIALLFVMSFMFLKPFITPIVWGIIIAVAIYPLHKKLSKKLGGKEKLSATIFVLIGIGMIIIPTAMFTNSTLESTEAIKTQFQNGTISLPAPTKKIEDLPLIGKKLYSLWDQAYVNLSALAEKHLPEIKSFATSALASIGSIIGTVFIFLISIIISGALLVNAKTAEKTSKAVFGTLAGKNAGEQFSNLASATIRSVVQGVLGTAMIQVFALSIGLFLIDFPAAGIVTIILLFCAIAQLPLLLVCLPIILYVFSYAGTTAAVVFAIWTVLWSIADNVLKPMLMGRGVDIPMLVILLGAIGGMIYAGIIGLFIGAVFLAFSYKFFQAIIKAN